MRSHGLEKSGKLTIAPGQVNLFFWPGELMLLMPLLFISSSH